MRPSVRVVAATPGCTVQDAGRPGRLASGVPPSGPLDPTAFAAANLRVGNAPGVACIEVPLGALRVVAEAACVASIDGEPALALSPGDEIVVSAATRAVRYLAIAGGLDVPLVLGSRSTLVVAGFGGLEGRALRGGDVLPVGATRPSGGESAAAPTVADPPDPARLMVRPGPHAALLGEEAWERLLATTWTVSRRSDRVGTRLDGAALPRRAGDVLGPSPMLRGCVQITSDGTPVVLGPDHPTTGGYPVLAFVSGASRAMLARLRPGRALRFAL